MFEIYFIISKRKRIRSHKQSIMLSRGLDGSDSRKNWDHKPNDTVSYKIRIRIRFLFVNIGSCYLILLDSAVASRFS